MRRPIDERVQRSTSLEPGDSSTSESCQGAPGLRLQNVQSDVQVHGLQSNDSQQHDSHPQLYGSMFSTNCLERIAKVSDYDSDYD
jgi:hypothetical protein